MQPSVDKLRELMNDRESVKDKLADMRETDPSVRKYVGLQTEVKNKEKEIKDTMLNLFRTHGIQTVKGAIETAYVKEDHPIYNERIDNDTLTAIRNLNPDAISITDKAIRDTIKIAMLAKANGDVSEDIQRVLDMDLDKIRGPAEYTAVVRG